MGESLAKSRRFRFGLRAVFVVMTLAGLAVGYWAARRRAAERMADRHNAVINQLIENVSQPPPGLTFLIPQNSKGQLEKYFGGRIGAESLTRQMTHTVLALGEINTHASSGALLDLTSAASKPSQQVLGELMRHYETGLPSLGFGQRSNTRSNREISSLWSAIGADLSVLIDARIADDDRSATVRVLFINSEELDVW